ncbi:MAG: secretin N-terminal domain-containing protein [bacterium]
MRKILQLIIVALVLINISLAATVSRVEIKEIDSTVKITLNTVTSYKLFFKDDKIRVLLKDTDLNLSQTEASLMPGGPVSKVSLYPEGNNSYVDIMLNYSSVNYKAYVSGNFTIIEVSEKNLPEPVGPKTVESSSKKVRNYIVLSAPTESYTVSSSNKSTKSEVEVKKVDVSKKSTTRAQTSSKTQKSTTSSNQVLKPASRTITLDLVDATLVDTVRLITENLGWNVIFSPEVIKYQEKLTMKLVNVEPEKALRMILLANGFDYKVIEGIAYVSTPDKLEKFQQDVKVVGPMKTQVINLENASAKEIEPIIKANFPEASVQVVEKTNSLLVKAPVKSIVEIKNLIGQLDVPPPPPPPMTPPITEVIRLNYAQARDVIQMMGNLVPKEAMVEDARMNSLIVTGTPDIIDTVKSFVKAVDVPMPQLAIRLHFLQVDETANRALGVDWGSYANNIRLTEQRGGVNDLGIAWFSRNNLEFQAALNYLIESRKGRVLSAPYVMTQNRQQAEIQVGQQIPILYTDYRTGQIQAQYINVGIILRFTPEISPDGYVTLNLQPEVSELGPQIPGTQYFIINTNRIQNTVRIKQGDTVLIGGLLRNITGESVKRVPLLSDIPIIGEIFKARARNKGKTELIVAITPVVLTDLPKINETMHYERIEKRGLKMQVEEANKF